MGRCGVSYLQHLIPVNLCLVACEHAAENWDDLNMPALVHQDGHEPHIIDPKYTVEICLIVSNGLMRQELSNKAEKNPIK